MEHWRKIEEFWDYSVSDKGNVRNDVTGNILKHRFHKEDGARHVGLWNGRQEKHRQVHRLVAEAFLQDVTDLWVIHIDGNKANNCLENLEIYTYNPFRFGFHNKLKSKERFLEMNDADDLGLGDKERWRTIKGFKDYRISNRGRLYNQTQDFVMTPSRTRMGTFKINLVDDNGVQVTRSVGKLVAEAFVEPSDAISDAVVYLDGDLSNLDSRNLVWRPRWFMHKYQLQLKERHPEGYYNLEIINVQTGTIYPNIVSAGVAEGLLFSDLWRSTYTGAEIYPNGHEFYFTGKVLPT